MRNHQACPLSMLPRVGAEPAHSKMPAPERKATGTLCFRWAVLALASSLATNQGQADQTQQDHGHRRRFGNGQDRIVILRVDRITIGTIDLGS